MPRKVVKVLLVEDDEDDFLLFKKVAGRVEEFSINVTWISGAEDALPLFNKCDFDVCLLDYRLGEDDGITLINKAKESGCIKPIIILTGQSDKELSIDALRHGADDYLLKNELNHEILSKSIRYAIERKQTQLQEEELIKEKASAENFRNLAETIPQLVWVSNPEGVNEFYNQRWFEFTKMDPDNALENGWVRFIHPEDSEQALKAWKYSLSTGMPYEMEYRLQNGKTHEYSWFLCRALPVKDSKGKIIKWFGTCTDINEQKLTEAELRKVQSIFRALYEANILGVVLAGLDGIVFQANDAYLNIVGYSRGDLVKGKINWYQLTPEEYRPKEVEKIRELETTGIASSWEKEFIRKDGSQAPVIIGVALLNKSKGETIAFVLDITERKRLEQRKDEFLGIASHELKTPLTSVKGYVQILEGMLKNIENEKVKEYISRTNTYVDRLNSLIADLLDVSKIQAGKLEFNIDAFSFDDLVHDSVSAIQPTAGSHQIIIKNNIKQKMIGDKQRLEQVLMNLLSNAIKYSPEANKIIVNSTKKDKEIEVSVTDFGIGIPNGNTEKIFDRFYRVEKTSRDFSGLGIGLYISYEIINRHGGRIWVESEEGKGSTFYFTLPIKKVKS